MEKPSSDSHKVFHCFTAFLRLGKDVMNYCEQ